MKQVDKPFYKSTKVIVYLITLLALILMVALSAPENVLGSLANAIAVGLPVLIGGQAFIDQKAVSAKTKDEA